MSSVPKRQMNSVPKHPFLSNPHLRSLSLDDLRYLDRLVEECGAYVVIAYLQLSACTKSAKSTVIDASPEVKTKRKLLDKQMTKSFSPGQTIQIRCEIRPGPFSGEFLVACETADGPISGFVREDDLEKTGESEGYVFAVVKKVSADTLTVMVRGSFFTTNGLAHLRRDWANSHVR